MKDKIQEFIKKKEETISKVREKENGRNKQWFKNDLINHRMIAEGDKFLAEIILSLVKRVEKLETELASEEKEEKVLAKFEPQYEQAVSMVNRFMSRIG